MVMLDIDYGESIILMVEPVSSEKVLIKQNDYQFQFEKMHMPLRFFSKTSHLH